jgi:hypothetical protein
MDLFASLSLNSVRASDSITLIAVSLTWPSLFQFQHCHSYFSTVLLKEILPRDGVPVDGVGIGNRIYLTQLVTALYKSVSRTDWHSQSRASLRCLVAASISGRSPSSGFPNYPWPRLPAAATLNWLPADFFTLDWHSTRLTANDNWPSASARAAQTTPRPKVLPIFKECTCCVILYKFFVFFPSQHNNH